jgi:hypothetical protein
LKLKRLAAPTIPNLSAEQPDPGLRLLRGLLTP